MIRKFIVITGAALLWSVQAYPENPTAIQVASANPAPVAPLAASGSEVAKVEPYRTFITIQRYTMENNGEPSTPISNVRISVVFPNGTKMSLPENNQWWPIGNGQAQEINRTYELPWAFVQNDGFKFKIQMERKGSAMFPCEFDVSQLSQFNRGYTCHTDTAWQTEHHTPTEQLDKEGVQIRVFSSKNALPKEIPTDALAIR